MGVHEMLKYNILWFTADIEGLIPIRPYEGVSALFKWLCIVKCVCDDGEYADNCHGRFVQFLASCELSLKLVLSLLESSFICWCIWPLSSLAFVHRSLFFTFRYNIDQQCSLPRIFCVEWVQYHGQSSYCIRQRVWSSALVAEQVPKEELVSGLELVTEENMPQLALTSFWSQRDPS